MRLGQVNKNLYYYKTHESEIWRDAEEIEYDTYDYDRAWVDDPNSVEGDIRTGAVTGWKVYVYMNVEGRMKWRVADIVEAQLGGCVVRRDTVGYARAICLEGGTIDACGSHLVNLNLSFSEGYYICKNTDALNEFKWEWVLANEYEYDTYKLPHDTTGRVLKGRVTNGYYVWNGDKFEKVEGLDVAVGHICSERNIDQVFKYVVGNESPKVYKCLNSGWKQVDGSFSAHERMGYVIDADGNKDSVMAANSQIWMPKNLDIVVDSSYCYDDESKCAKCGRLYTWNAAKNACPEGWHLPDAKEWQTLINEVDFDALVTESGWGISMSLHGSDEYGFMAFPAGFRESDGTYDTDFRYAYFWSSTEDDNGKPYCFEFYYFSSIKQISRFEKDDALSVRCVLD